MLLDISIEKSIELVGKNGSTTTKDLARVLNQNGFECDSRLTRTTMNCGLPELCIVKLKFDDQSTGHWIIWNARAKTFHDPSYNNAADKWDYYRWLSMSSRNARITSFLKIRINR